MSLYEEIKKEYATAKKHTQKHSSVEITIEIPFLGLESLFIYNSPKTVVIYFGPTEEIWFDIDTLKYHKFHTPIGIYADIVDRLLDIFKEYYTPNSVKFIKEDWCAFLLLLKKYFLKQKS